MVICMEYHYKSDMKAIDFFWLSMHRVYRSMAGVCNIIFTVALILLTVKFWNGAADLWQIGMLFGCILFPVIQPVEIYLRAKKQVAMLPEDMELLVNEEGLHVTADHKKSFLHWDKINNVVREPNMIIIFSDARHGYMLTDRVLGETKDALFAFVKAKIEHKN